MAFSDKYIQALKPGKNSRRIFEQASDPGFGVRVTPAGTKGFFLAYYHDGKRRFMNLGTYPSTSLAAARKRCRAARGDLEERIDPQEKRRLEDLAKQRETKAGTVDHLFDEYLAHLRKAGSSSAYQIEKGYAHDIKEHIGALNASEVRPSHIKEILFQVIERGAMIKANRVRAWLSAAFKFAIEYDNDPRNLRADVIFGVEMNPVSGVPKPQKKEAPGDRELSRDEIKDLWDRLDGAGMAFLTASAIRLILATGQRVGEVLGAPWQEFDIKGKKWEIPASRTKNKRAHVVPLADLHIEILEALKPVSGASPWVFPKKDGKGPMGVDSISQAVRRFCMPGPKSDREPFPKFEPRDLRRTWKTRAGEIGIPKEIRDRLQNHSLTDVSSEHYDRYDYLKEKREGMEKWAEWLGKVVGENDE